MDNLKNLVTKKNTIVFLRNGNMYHATSDKTAIMMCFGPIPRMMRLCDYDKALKYYDNEQHVPEYDIMLITNDAGHILWTRPDNEEWLKEFYSKS